MITAIVAGVVMAVFCLSLLLVTYSLYAQTAKRNELIQCKYAAGNMAQQLQKQLLDRDSDLVRGLGAEIRKQNPDGGYMGTWAPAGTSSSEADELIEYKLDYKGSEDILRSYDFDVSFKYVRLGESVSDAGGESIDYDGQFGSDDEADLAEWDKMDSDMSGAGGYMVTMKVTCSRGNAVYIVKKDVPGVEFD